MHSFRHRVEYLLYRVAKRVVCLLPHRQSRRLGRGLGYLFFAVAPGYRRLARENLRRALPELGAAERKRTVRACFLHWCQTAVEGVSLTRFEPRELRGMFDVVGREHFEGARAEGRGVLLVSAHWGAFEALGFFLGTHLDRPHILVRPPSNPLMAKELAEVRSGPGTVAIDRKVGARGFARVLERGGVCALASDQRVPPRNGLLLDFLGLPAWTTILPAYLAGRNGSPVVPFHAEPIAGGRYRVTFLEPLRVADRSREEAARKTQEINDLVGELIRSRPEYWLWLHTRWKRTMAYRWEKTRRKIRQASGIAEGSGLADPALESVVDHEFLEQGRSLLVLGEGEEAQRQALAALGDRWLEAGLVVRQAAAGELATELLELSEAARLQRLRELDQVDLLLLSGTDDALAESPQTAAMVASVVDWRDGRRSVACGSRAPLQLRFDERVGLA